MNKRRLIITALIHAGVLLLLAAACLIARSAMASAQQSQKQAERWAGESGRPFVQFSCLFTRDGRKDLESVYELRQKYRDKFSEADLEGDPETLYCDAWSGMQGAAAQGAHGKQQGRAEQQGNESSVHKEASFLRSGSWTRKPAKSSRPGLSGIFQKRWHGRDFYDTIINTFPPPRPAEEK